MATVLGPVEGTFTGTGQSDDIRVLGRMNFTLDFSGASATVSLQRSFDSGVTWYTVSKDMTPSKAEYTDDVNGVAEEAEGYVLYRLNCIAYSSGTITYRLGKSVTPEYLQDIR